MASSISNAMGEEGQPSNDYELQRLKRIQQNKERLQQLGLPKLADNLHPKDEQPSSAVEFNRPLQQSQPVRVSGRRSAQAARTRLQQQDEEGGSDEGDRESEASSEEEGPSRRVGMKRSRQDDEYDPGKDDGNGSQEEDLQDESEGVSDDDGQEQKDSDEGPARRGGNKRKAVGSTPGCQRITRTPAAAGSRRAGTLQGQAGKVQAGVVTTDVPADEDDEEAQLALALALSMEQPPPTSQQPQEPQVGEGQELRQAAGGSQGARLATGGKESSGRHDGPGPSSSNMGAAGAPPPAEGAEDAIEIMSSGSDLEDGGPGPAGAVGSDGRRGGGVEGERGQGRSKPSRAASGRGRGRGRGRAGAQAVDGDQQDQEPGAAPAAAGGSATTRGGRGGRKGSSAAAGGTGRGPKPLITPPLSEQEAVTMFESLLGSHTKAHASASITRTSLTEVLDKLGQSSDEEVVANMLRYAAERTAAGGGGDGAGTSKGAGSSSNSSSSRLTFEQFQMLVAELCAVRQGS